MAAKPKPTNEKPDEKDQNEVETEGGSAPACARSFSASPRRRGAGHDRAQRADGDTPLVRLDLYASPPPAAGRIGRRRRGRARELSELEGVRAELVQASRREQELRTALAEQVEAYERRLIEESDARQATMLGERDARIATMETELLERERRITNERRELDAERKRLSQLQSAVAAEQSEAQKRRA